MFLLYTTIFWGSFCTWAEQLKIPWRISFKPFSYKEMIEQETLQLSEIICFIFPVQTW